MAAGEFDLERLRRKYLGPKEAVQAGDSRNPSSRASKSTGPAFVPFGGRASITVTAPFGAPLITERTALSIAEEAVASLADELRGFDAVIVAAFGDPGRARLAAALGVPVIGIGEASMEEAARQSGGRFSVATTTPLLEHAIRALAESYGHGDALASVRTPAEDSRGGAAAPMEDPAAVEEALERCIRTAIETDGARAVIVGGGPLGAAAAALATRLGGECQVVEPIPAAVRRLARYILRCSYW